MVIQLLLQIEQHIEHVPGDGEVHLLLTYHYLHLVDAAGEVVLEDATEDYVALVFHHQKPLLLAVEHRKEGGHLADFEKLDHALTEELVEPDLVEELVDQLVYVGGLVHAVAGGVPIYQDPDEILVLLLEVSTLTVDTLD